MAGAIPPIEHWRNAGKQSRGGKRTPENTTQEPDRSQQMVHILDDTQNPQTLTYTIRNKEHCVEYLTTIRGPYPKHILNYHQPTDPSYNNPHKRYSPQRISNVNILTLHF